MMKFDDLSIKQIDVFFMIVSFGLIAAVLYEIFTRK